jgi:hypothetical protein
MAALPSPWPGKVALHKVMALITQSRTVGVHASTPCEARQWLRHPRKTSHMCMPTALSAMQSGEATANVVRYGILIMAMLVTAPWRRSTAQQHARAAPRWLPKESPNALPSVESSGPSPPHSSCALPASQPRTVHNCTGVRWAQHVPPQHACKRSYTAPLWQVGAGLPARISVDHLGKEDNVIISRKHTHIQRSVSVKGSRCDLAQSAVPQEERSKQTNNIQIEAWPRGVPVSEQKQARG